MALWVMDDPGRSRTRQDEGEGGRGGGQGHITYPCWDRRAHGCSGPSFPVMECVWEGMIVSPENGVVRGLAWERQACRLVLDRRLGSAVTR